MSIRPNEVPAAFQIRPVLLEILARTFFPNHRTYTGDLLTDGVARIIFVSAIFPIYLMLWLGFEASPVSRVAPTQGLLKDAQLTELPRRGILLEHVKCV